MQIKNLGGEKKKKMKTKTSSFGKAFLSKKRFAVVEIAIVLCSVFLVALPAIAAEQTTQEVNANPNTITTASEDDYVLGVYGNANEDDTIDMRDLTYVKLIFFGKKPETELADAKYDGEINPLDFIQIKLIIVGKEKEITIICDPPYKTVVTVNKPLGRVVVFSSYAAEAIRVLKVADNVVAVSNSVSKGSSSEFFPELSKLPNIGSPYNPDIEKILALEGGPPGAIITYDKYPSPEILEDKLPENVIVLRFGFKFPKLMMENFKMLGYIFDRKDETEEFSNFYEGHLNKIKARTEGLSEDKKPRVYLEGYDAYIAHNKNTPFHELCTLAGGISIGADLPVEGWYTKVDPEWVIQQNPDIIVRYIGEGCGYGEDDPSKMKAIREEIMNRPELAKVTAVENGRVYCLGIPLIYKPRNFAGAEYMAKWFHPELFEDLGPKASHKEYVERYHDMPYKGIYVYPPLAS